MITTDAASSGRQTTDWNWCQDNAGRLMAGSEAALWVQPRVPWFADRVPACAGVYVVWAEDYEAPLYVGECRDLSARRRTRDHATRCSALRHRVGREVFGFETQSGGFTPEEDAQVTDYLARCSYVFLPVRLGRTELEEFLVRKHQPRLNRELERRTERRQPVPSS